MFEIDRCQYVHLENFSISVAEGAATIERPSLEPPL